MAFLVSGVLGPVLAAEAAGRRRQRLQPRCIYRLAAVAAGSPGPVVEARQRILHFPELLYVARDFGKIEIDEQEGYGLLAAVGDLVGDRVGDVVGGIAGRQGLEGETTRCRLRLGDGNPELGGRRKVFDHHRRDLSSRLLEKEHGRAGEIIATLHLHLDHDNCLEAIIIQGKPNEIEKITSKIAALRGVKFARLSRASRLDV